MKTARKLEIFYHEQDYDILNSIRQVSAGVYVIITDIYVTPLGMPSSSASQHPSISSPASPVVSQWMHLHHSIS